MRYVGVDVSLKRLDVAEGRGKEARRYPNTTEGIDRLVHWLRGERGVGGVHAVLEPTSTYHLGLIQAPGAGGDPLHRD